MRDCGRSIVRLLGESSEFLLQQLQRVVINKTYAYQLLTDGNFTSYSRYSRSTLPHVRLLGWRLRMPNLKAWWRIQVPTSTVIGYPMLPHVSRATTSKNPMTNSTTYYHPLLPTTTRYLPQLPTTTHYLPVIPATTCKLSDFWVTTPKCSDVWLKWYHSLSPITRSFTCNCRQLPSITTYYYCCLKTTNCHLIG